MNQVGRIPTLINDYETVVLENIGAAIAVLASTAEEYEEALADQANYQPDQGYDPMTDNTLKDSDVNMKALLDLKHQAEAEFNVLKDVQTQLQFRQIEPADCPGTFETRLATRLADPKDPKQDESYKDFRKRLFKVRNPRRVFKFEDEEDEDDDIQMVMDTIQTKCPFTQLVMKKVYQGPCGHSYSEAVFEMIDKCYGGSLACPITGCRGFLSRANLKENKRMAEQIARDVRRAEEQLMQDGEDID